tara:strand:- start:898 stop:1128 length:231 start_codon:yes stop_codon:yes gene_type:complete
MAKASADRRVIVFFISIFLRLIFIKLVIYVGLSSEMFALSSGLGRKKIVFGKIKLSESGGEIDGGLWETRRNLEEN